MSRPDDATQAEQDEQLVDATARQFLAEDLKRVADPLALGKALRKRLTQPLARLAAERIDLWQRAEGKLAHARRLRLTRVGLEQATHRLVARERARRFASVNGIALDATAGLGGDAMQLASAGLDVVALEQDPVRARYLTHNLRAFSSRAWAVRGSAMRPPLRRFDTLLVDPDRRKNGQRTLDPRRSEPPWDVVEQLVCDTRALACVKFAPGLDPAMLQAPRSPHVWSWVALGGELKELALWAGPAVTFGGPHEALALRGDEVHRRHGTPSFPRALADPTSVAWLAEVDPALVRAGLAGPLAEELGLGAVTSDGGYLGGSEAPESPWVSSLRVVDSAPFDAKHVRRLLARHDVGPLTVKKRGIGTSADELTRRWKGKGSRPGTLVALRHATGHHVWLVER